MALFKNKETDKKRKGENVIGKIIYGFLLFAPLMSILFTSLYTVFNKNAFQSYYGENINQSENVNMVNKNLEQDYTYEFYSNFNQVTGLNYDSLYLDVIQIDYVKDDNTTNTLKQNEDSIVSLLFFVSNNIQYMQFRDADNVVGTNIIIAQSTINFHYQYNGISTGATALLNYVKEVTYYKVYNKYSFLDNAFEYGMYKTEQSNIYNWSKTTGTYTVLQNVCTGIGITNTFVPMLMAYWLLISIIYFLFDIALILIWAVHDKIHALKDAI